MIISCKNRAAQVHTHLKKVTSADEHSFFAASAFGVHTVNHGPSGGRNVDLRISAEIPSTRTAFPFANNALLCMITDIVSVGS